MLAVCCTHPLLILLSPPLEHHIGAQHILDAAPHFRRLVVQTVLAVLVQQGQPWPRRHRRQLAVAVACGTGGAEQR